MKTPLLQVEIRLEQDVVLARQRARQVAGHLGFDPQDQTRIATAVSEMARNAFKYAGGGRADFLVDTDAGALCVDVIDEGPGIPDPRKILEGRYQSSTGMGMGILGARRLMDSFEVHSRPGATRVTMTKRVPRRVAALTGGTIRQLVAELASHRPGTPLEEIQQQNQELLRTLEEVRAQREALAQVNRELEETNRGVVALYAELDERTDFLQRAHSVKTKFLSNMTHEFRTPLNSIVSLTRLLLGRFDGDLSAEQEKQVRFIARSAEELGEIVNDLLDLAKVEAGKIEVKPSEFRVSELFAALRGMLRPLLAQNSALTLTFDDPGEIPGLYTDESKVSQILRNFISNAIKYTETGEVRVSARMSTGDTVVFDVSDTGIGIAPEDQQRVWEEFAQVDSPLQRKVKGTGLGLPLSRKLAGLLGGTVRMKSELGVGSTFSALLPAHFRGDTAVSLIPDVGKTLDPIRAPVLVVEDDRETMLLYDRYLRGSGFQVLPARTLYEARGWLRTTTPVAVVLDVLLEGESTWDFVDELRRTESTREVPIIVVTVVANEPQALARGANAFHTKPIDQDWLLGTLRSLARERARDVVLLIDDDEVSRYILRGLLADTPFRIVEAGSGSEGLRLANELLPRAIFLDLVMPELDGFTVLEQLQSSPALQGIPVIIHTGKRLSDRDRERLRAAAGILSKESRSRAEEAAAVKEALGAAGITWNGGGRPAATSTGEQHT